MCTPIGLQGGEAQLELIDAVGQEGDLRLEPDLALGPALDAGRAGGPAHDGVERHQALRPVGPVDEAGRISPLRYQERSADRDTPVSASASAERHPAAWSRAGRTGPARPASGPAARPTHSPSLGHPPHDTVLLTRIGSFSTYDTTTAWH